jgi:hypothetical protein
MLVIRLTLLVFRDGEPILLGYHLAPGSILMLTLAAFKEAVEHLVRLVREVRSLAEVALDAVDGETELSLSTREAIRVAWFAVGSAEAAMQVALVPLVVPDCEYDPVRWAEDVAHWVAWITRYLRMPLLSILESDD